MIRRKKIAYPFACCVNGKLVHIDDSFRGFSYFCPSCQSKMIPKLGSMNKHHFAHMQHEYCQPDRVLHDTATSYIIWKFRHCQPAMNFMISVPCSRCYNGIKYDLTAAGAQIKPEFSIIKGTRSDLVVLKSDMSAHTIIEIVVTHDLEPRTRMLYQKSEIPVIKIMPKWDDLLYVKSTMNVTCEKCIIQDNTLTSFMSNMSRCSVPREITHDRYGTKLRHTIHSMVNQYARMLAHMGFMQQGNPSLFIHENVYWKICVELDSTDTITISQVDGIPQLYAVPKTEERFCYPPCKACILKYVAKKLADAGITTWRDFSDDGEHWHMYRN